MGDLAKYIAEVVEFVVAGVLVFFSLLLLGYVVVRPDLAELPDELPFLSSLGGLLPVVGVALIYALGIIAEGMSRIMFEHGLGELTHEKLTKQTLAKRPADPDEPIGATSGPDVEEAKKRRHDAEVKHYEGVREEWRMYVLAHSASLNAQVDGQLKRLRIERAAALSGGISSMALLIDVAVTASQRGMGLQAALLVTLVLASSVAARMWLVGEQVPVVGEAVVLAASDGTEEATAPDQPPPAGSATRQSVPQVPPSRKVVAWWKKEVHGQPARAVTLSGVALALLLLIGLVAEAGTEIMGLRAALLVVTLVVTSCAVALSLVRLDRYVNSIIRCYLALKTSAPSPHPLPEGAPTS